MSLASSGVDDLAQQDLSKTFVFSLPANDRVGRTLDRNPVHLMPCKIQHSGSAAVSVYFHPELVQTSATAGQAAPTKQIFKAAFRGRQVTGSKIALPDTCVGLVLEDERSGGSTAKPSAAAQGGKPIAVSKDQAALAAAEKALEASAHSIALTGRFDALYVWNKDDKRTDQAYVERAVTEMLAVCDALHSD